uniref:NADH-ubiquinone oxidoreductase chain 4L n=1 Tax=Pselaphinae sp. 12 EF-2015 TaxID=1756871 RepID=A0A0S2M8L6_9COLE|nr:NADH deshydrogenase subunit 4L [Pselaphinae sp. 12 EF-2015]
MLSMLMFILSLVSFCLKRKYLLLMLLSLELIVLSLYFNMFMLLIMFNYELFMVMIFLTMSVCEGVLGLSILVSLIRTHGKDYMKSLSILW